MRKITFLLIIVVILPIFGLEISAEDSVDKYITEFEEILPPGYEDIVSDDTALIDAVGIKALLSEISLALLGHKGEAVSFFLTLIGVSGVSAILGSLNERTKDITSSVLGVILSVMIYERARGLFESVLSSLSELRDFFSALLPISVGITALGGGSASAGVQGSAMYFTLSLLDGVGGRIFSSLCGFGLSMSLISAFGSEGVGSVSRGIKNVFTFILGTFTVILSGTVALQTMIASASDGMAMRTVKYLASGVIPVVGSTVSGALSTLASGVSYAKSVVGIGAVAVIIAIAVSPLTLMLLYRLAMSLSLVFTDFLGARAASGVISSFRSALDSLIALYSLSAVIYIFEIVLFVKSGVALL